MKAHGQHSHSFKDLKEKNVLVIVLCLTAGFMVIEVIAGFHTGSLALLSDAVHMFTDVFAISIALLALWFSLKPPTSGKTFGFYRAEILAAFFNSLLLFAISLVIIVEAYKRLLDPSEVKSLEMTIVAGIGLIINIIGAYLLSKYQRENLNIRGAFYHVISDALGSVGTLIAGLIILKTKWYYADSIISIAISLLIIRGAWGLFRESVHILLEGTPKGIELSAVESAIRSQAGVLGVHDLHAWTLTQGFEALSAHLVIEDMGLSENLIKDLKKVLFDKFRISHVTLQVETNECESGGMSCYETTPQS
ncbi:cation diffusion facilitator family transporter [Desulfobacterota bacterium AH_259_B03_O07]|nr:cation diffusion facilitator family transporter [Desulfobacterota bacterium AH_259_B03_O07]